jgi:hypothetical protein
MGPKKGPPLRRKRLTDIKASEHPYDIRSNDWLRAKLVEEIKKVFVGSLRAVETRLGTGFESFEPLRGEILRLGNDCIREMHKLLDNVNVEFIPRTIIKVSASSKGAVVETAGKGEETKDESEKAD